MIYPTRTAVIATAAGAPFALAFAAIEPGRWILALAWPLAIVLLTAFDAVRGIGGASARFDFPGHAYVGESRDCTVTVSVRSRPRSAWVALQNMPIIALENDGLTRVPLDSGRGAVLVTLGMVRRGIASRTRSIAAGDSVPSGRRPNITVPISQPRTPPAS